MSEREEKKRKLRELSRQSKERTDEILDDEIQVLKLATRIDLEALLPKVTDKETYERLIAAVEQSTLQNESLADLKSRLEKIGAGCSSVVKEVVRLLKPI